MHLSAYANGTLGKSTHAEAPFPTTATRFPVKSMSTQRDEWKRLPPKSDIPLISGSFGVSRIPMADIRIWAVVVDCAPVTTSSVVMSYCWAEESQVADITFVPKTMWGRRPYFSLSPSQYLRISGWNGCVLLQWGFRSEEREYKWMGTSEEHP